MASAGLPFRTSLSLVFFFSVFCPELETDQDVGEFVEPYRRGLRPRDGQVLLPPLAAGVVMGSGD